MLSFSKLSGNKTVAASFSTGSTVVHGSLQAFILFIGTDSKLPTSGRSLFCLVRFFKGLHSWLQIFSFYTEYLPTSHLSSEMKGFESHCGIDFHTCPFTALFHYGTSCFI